ncbi:MAG: SGNH/GDSL hydrolase family protein [Acidobacteria bacterium]|nr:SGNH/GDSL hydrolase family protein [Acidobacteriota bacterium]
MFYYSSFRVLFLATFSIILFSLSSHADYQVDRQITIYNPSDSVKQITPLPKRNIGLFFDKLRANKPVTVAYLGGSVIAGAGASNPEKSSCRALINSWLRSHYPRNIISEINAAIPGTGSLYGALRARRDLIAFKPDLVFIEFALNDAGEDETAVKKAMEGLIRQLLVVPQPPEIVLLYATNAKRNIRTELQEYIAAHYQIPSIDLQTKTWAQIDSGKISASSFWKDGMHPTDAGHKIYGEIITAFLTEQENLPPTALVRNLSAPLLSDEMNYGEFKAFAEIKHDATWRNESSNDRTLPAALLSTDKSGAQLEYYFEGTVIGISFRMGPDCGTIEVLIDGKPAPPPLARVDCHDSNHHIGTRIIAGGLSLGEHKLTIRVLGEKNPKSSGNNVRLGYLLIGGARPERL